MTTGVWSKPSIRNPISSLIDGLIGPRITVNPRFFNQSRAASNRAAAMVGSFSASKNPKKPTPSWWRSVCASFFTATIRPTTLPEESRAMNCCASAWAKNGFLGSSKCATSLRRGGTQYGCPLCRRYGSSINSLRSGALFASVTVTFAMLDHAGGSPDFRENIEDEVELVSCVSRRVRRADTRLLFGDGWGHDRIREHTIVEE